MRVVVAYEMTLAHIPRSALRYQAGLESDWREGCADYCGAAAVAMEDAESISLPSRA